MDLFQMWLSSKSLGHAGTCHTKWAVELWSTEAAAFRSELSSLWHAGACLFGKASGLCGDETSPPQMGKQEFACSERPPAFVVTRTSPPQMGMQELATYTPISVCGDEDVPTPTFVATRRGRLHITSKGRFRRAPQPYRRSSSGISSEREETVYALCRHLADSPLSRIRITFKKSVAVPIFRNIESKYAGCEAYSRKSILAHHPKRTRASPYKPLCNGLHMLDTSSQMGSTDGIYI